MCAVPTTSSTARPAIVHAPPLSPAAPLPAAAPLRAPASCLDQPPRHLPIVAQAGSLRNATGSQACLDGFKAWLASPCIQAASAATELDAACCQPLLDLGIGCWAQVLTATGSNTDATRAV